MINKIKNISILALVITILSTNVFANGNAVVSLGKDLNLEQRQEMIDLFGADSEDEIIEVTNEEERQYLGQYVDSKVLGSRAISSSYVKPGKKGSGIKVETYNITWVTEDMLINALVTAGVKDAEIKVAAPFNVSGTAALTGVIKGFEGATGENISEEEKQIASEEIAKTGELGDEIGQDEATQIIKKVKEEMVERGIKSPEDIKELIEEASQEINITLTEEQKEKISQLMEKISNLDLNVEDIKSQLQNISDKLKELGENTEEIKGFVAKILDFLGNIFTRLGELIKG